MSRHPRLPSTLSLLVLLPTLTLAQYGVPYAPPAAATTVPSSPASPESTPKPSPNAAPDAATAAALAHAHKLNRVLVGHAVLGTVALLALVPAALLVGRWLRRFGWWMTVHRGLNGLGVGMVVAAFGMGYWHVGQNGAEDHWDGAHPRLVGRRG